jgi:PadR family transcriptional regulator PadR
MDREQLKGHLDLLLLAVLQRGPAHGYAIITALRDSSQGTFDLPEGTIYPALHRLEAAGLLRSGCEITDAGATALQARRDEWRRFAGGVQAVLGWSA